MVNININTSLGDVIDRISILDVKKEKIKDENKLDYSFKYISEKI
jgi:hypothetical protein